jgi:hypothetical protein
MMPSNSLWASSGQKSRRRAVQRPTLVFVIHLRSAEEPRHTRPLCAALSANTQLGLPLSALSTRIHNVHSMKHTNTQCTFLIQRIQQLTAAQKVSSIRRVSCRTSGKNDFRHSRHSNSYITQDTAGHHRSHYTNGCADDSDDDGLNGAACTARPRRCSVQGGLCLAAPSRIRSGWGAGARSSVGSPGHYR